MYAKGLAPMGNQVNGYAFVSHEFSGSDVRAVYEYVVEKSIATRSQSSHNSSGIFGSVMILTLFEILASRQNLSLLAKYLDLLIGVCMGSYRYA